MPFDDKTGHYLAEAKRCRQKATVISDPVLRAQLLGIALTYETLARQFAQMVIDAEQREAADRRH